MIGDGSAEINKMSELLIHRPQIADIPGVWKWSNQKAVIYNLEAKQVIGSKLCGGSE